MKKYNLSAIMKRAWELVKKAKMAISSALKIAWKEAKLKEVKDMPELTGSEKQVKWANEIRNKVLEVLDSIEYPYLKEEVLEKTDAKYFIDEFKVMTATWKDEEYKRRFVISENYSYSLKNAYYTLRYARLFRKYFDNLLGYR